MSYGVFDNSNFWSALSNIKIKLEDNATNTYEKEDSLQDITKPIFGLLKK